MGQVDHCLCLASCKHIKEPIDCQWWETFPHQAPCQNYSQGCVTFLAFSFSWKEWLIADTPPGRWEKEESTSDLWVVYSPRKRLLEISFSAKTLSFPHGCAAWGQGL